MLLTENDLSLPVLSVLPQLQPREAGHDKVRVEPFSAYSEAVSLLRQSLQGAGSDRTSIVLVTSAEESVGKTTVAASLAEAARASGRNVLLVDADLRFAGLSALYQMEDDPGLCDILRGHNCMPEDGSASAVLDVILGLAQKTMSNYINHVAETPVDEVFQPLKWTRSATPLEV